MALSHEAKDIQRTEKPNVFILHCGLDMNKVERLCQKMDLALNFIAFRREEVFSYFVRLNWPRPDLIVIRSHFRSLVNTLNRRKDIPTIVVSTHEKPSNCLYPFIRADQGYQGRDSFDVYEKLAHAIHEKLSSG